MEIYAPKHNDWKENGAKLLHNVGDILLALEPSMNLEAGSLVRVEAVMHTRLVPTRLCATAN